MQVMVVALKGLLDKKKKKTHMKAKAARRGKKALLSFNNDTATSLPPLQKHAINLSCLTIFRLQPAKVFSLGKHTLTLHGKKEGTKQSCGRKRHYICPCDTENRRVSRSFVG